MFVTTLKSSLRIHSTFLHGGKGLLAITLTLLSRQNWGPHLSTKTTGMAEGCSSSEKQVGCVNEVYGDLFTCPETHSLAHCISADVKMGKGIAVMFKKLYGGVDELLHQRQRTGGLAVLKRDQRFVYYLVTKERYWDKPTYDTLRQSLLQMRNHNMRYGVKNVCMPEIGCGLDKLKWDKVLELINYVYKDTGIEITVYHYDDPNAKRHHRQQRNYEYDDNVSNPRRQHQQQIPGRYTNAQRQHYNQKSGQQSRRHDGNYEYDDYESKPRRQHHQQIPGQHSHRHDGKYEYDDNESKPRRQHHQQISGQHSHRHDGKYEYDDNESKPRRQHHQQISGQHSHRHDGKYEYDDNESKGFGQHRHYRHEDNNEQSSSRQNPDKQRESQRTGSKDHLGYSKQVDQAGRNRSIEESFVRKETSKDDSTRNTDKESQVQKEDCEARDSQCYTDQAKGDREGHEHKHSSSDDKEATKQSTKKKRKRNKKKK